MKITLTETAQLLKEHDNILLISHRHPDGDTLGSSYALCRALLSQGKNVAVICENDIPAALKFVAQGVQMPEFEPQYVIAIDVASMNMMGAEFSSRFAGKVDLCIDHHLSNDLYAENTLLDDTAAATAEIIYRLLSEMTVDISPAIADCLYVGVSTDTGCFRYSNLTSESFRIAAALIDLGADFARINKDVFETKSKSFAELEKLAINSTEMHFDGLCAVITVTRDMFEQSGCGDEEFDRISALPRQIEGVLIGASIREQSDGTYKVSVRTNPPLNAAEICKRMGGGGHFGAAGCTLTDSLDASKAILLENISAALAVENKLPLSL